MGLRVNLPPRTNLTLLLPVVTVFSSLLICLGWARSGGLPAQATRELQCQQRGERNVGKKFSRWEKRCGRKIRLAGRGPHDVGAGHLTPGLHGPNCLQSTYCKAGAGRATPRGQAGNNHIKREWVESKSCMFESKIKLVWNGSNSNKKKKKKKTKTKSWSRKSLQQNVFSWHIYCKFIKIQQEQIACWLSPGFGHWWNNHQDGREGESRDVLSGRTRCSALFAA